MQHRLKRTSNVTILGLSGNVPIQPLVLGSNKHTPHEGESRDITTTVLQHRQSSDYNMFRSTYYRSKLCKTVIQTTTVSSEFEKQRKKNTTATTRRISIPGQPKHGITRQGHCRPKTYPTLRTSQEAKSKAKINQRSDPQDSYLKKGFNSKAEYSNTQQDLTVNGYTQPI